MCLGCKRALAAEEFVTACKFWDANADYVQFVCPHCAAASDARLETGCVSQGYVYGAGGAHFSAQLSELLPSLRVERTRDGLKLSVAQMTRTLPRG